MDLINQVGLYESAEVPEKCKDRLRTSPANTPDTPLYVSGVFSDILLLSNEELAVAASSTSLLLSYTVPTGVNFYFDKIEISACSVSEFRVEVNSQIITKRRNAHGNYDLISYFGNKKYEQGDEIKIYANNVSNKINEYFCKLIGIIQDN